MCDDPYRHSDIKLERDMVWKCHDCGHVWEKPEMPIVIWEGEV
jgi:rubrerythrin